MPGEGVLVGFVGGMLAGGCVVTLTTMAAVTISPDRGGAIAGLVVGLLALVVAAWFAAAKLHKMTKN
jgi:thiamine transporter ThiT